MHKSLKDSVLEQSDIVEVVGERVALKRQGREFIGLCPFHDDHKPSMAVSPQKQIFKCWACGAGGDVIKFVQMLQRVDFREALRILAQRAGIDLRDSPEDRAHRDQREAIRPILDWAREHFIRNFTGPAGQSAREYAARRGLKQETIERFGIGLALTGWDDVLSTGRRSGLSPEQLESAGLVATSEDGRVYDRFRDRLMFPIGDASGRCIAFGGRTLSDDKAKYLNSPETALFQKSRTLFALDRARAAIARKREAIVVEGYLDAILLHQFGFEHVVATLGTALSDGHVRLLRSLATRVLLCFDSDEAGLRAADRGAEVALRHGLDVRVVAMVDGKDPADCVLSTGAEGFERRLQSCQDALEFRWQRTLQAYEAAGPQARRAAVEDFVSFVARASAGGGIDPLAKGLLVGRIAELLALPARSVYELLARTRVSAPAEARQTSDISESSAYAASLRGLPAGLVSAVEALFGVVLHDPPQYASAGVVLTTVSGLNEGWKRLAAILDRLAERGELNRAAVVAECDDAVLCELVARASDLLADPQRAAVAMDAGALCAELMQRVRAELDLLRVGHLRGRLGRDADGVEQAAAYEMLLRLGRTQSGLLGSEARVAPVLPGS